MEWRQMEIDRLQAEVERLRDALDECVPHIVGNIGAWEKFATQEGMVPDAYTHAQARIADGNALIEKIAALSAEKEE